MIKNIQAIGHGYKFEIEEPKNILFGKILVFFSLLKIKFLSFFYRFDVLILKINFLKIKNILF
jgi:hypothetical protein